MAAAGICDQSQYGSHWQAPAGCTLQTLCRGGRPGIVPRIVTCRGLLALLACQLALGPLYGLPVLGGLPGTGKTPAPHYMRVR